MANSSEPQDTSDSVEPHELASEQADYLQLSQSLRQLASCLVADPSSADDFVQEAWLAALQMPPGRIRDLNSWMSQVLRRLTSRERQRASRQRHVETQAASPEVSPEDGPNLDPVTARVLLSQAVSELGETSRAVIEARFFRGCAVSEIAIEMDCPEATVRTRLRRGIEELRGVLDRQHRGQRDAWTVLFLPLLGREVKNASPVGASNFRFPSKAALFLTALVVGPLLVWWTWNSGGDDAVALTRADSADLVTDSPSEATATEELGRVPSEPERVSKVEEQPPAQVIATRSLELVLRGQDGMLVQAFEAHVVGKDRELIGKFASDGEGRVTVDLPEASLIEDAMFFGEVGSGVKVYAIAPGQAWTDAYILPIPDAGASLELTTSGPAQSILGTVVDAGGIPVPGALVRAIPRNRSATMIKEGVVHNERLLEGLTDSQGRFELSGLRVTPHDIVVSATGMSSTKVLIEGLESSLEATLTLSAGARVVGVVLRPDGQPAVGARIWEPADPSLGLARFPKESFADELGRFELTGLDPGAHHIFAQAADVSGLFARTIIETDREGESHWDPSLVHTDGIHIRIVQENGEPVSSAVALLFWRDSGEGAAWSARQDVDSEGRVHFECVPEGDILFGAKRVGTTRAIEGVRAGLLSSADEVLIVLEDLRPANSSLSGQVLLADGSELKRAIVHGFYVTRPLPLRHVIEHSTGAFRVDSLEAGKCTLGILIEGLGGIALGVHELTSGELYDLGTIRAEATGQVILEWGAVKPSVGSRWILETDLGKTALKNTAVHTFERARLSMDLLPGTYALRQQSADRADAYTFEVRSNENVVCRVPQSE